MEKNNMEKNKEYLELSKMSEQELREELLSLRREIAYINRLMKL